MPQSPASDRPPTIDPGAAAHWAHAKPTGAPGESPWLHEEVARRMEERLGWIKRAPETWTHWEPIRGGMKAQALLARRYPKSLCRVQEDDPARAQLARSLLQTGTLKRLLSGGGARVEVADTPDGAAGMVWSNMALHASADPQALIGRWHRALEVDGFLMFSCLGPDTLRELRNLYADLGWPPPAHEFTDMHDWGDMLVHAGFAEPVMDMERIVLTWASPDALLAELRGLGRNLHPARFPALRGRAWQARLKAVLETHLADPVQDGRLRLTFEVIYGHAFKPVPKVKLSGESSVSLTDMRAMLNAPRPR